MKKSNYVLILAVLVLSSCAHHPDVRPGVNGLHTVKVAKMDKSEALTSAINQSRSYCKSKDGEAAFVSEKVTYTGSLDEKTHVGIDKFTKAIGLGGAIYSASGGADSDKKNGAVIATSGAASKNALLDEDAYTAIIKFKCI